MYKKVDHDHPPPPPAAPLLLLLLLFEVDFFHMMNLSMNIQQSYETKRRSREDLRIEVVCCSVCVCVDAEYILLGNVSIHFHVFVGSG